MKSNAKLLIGLACLSLGLTACKDDDVKTYSNNEILANAENALGVKIDPTQDWKMVTTVEANVTVNLGLDQQYSVYVYDENPLFSEDVVYYGRTTVAEGGTAHLTLSLPTAKTSYYVAVFDSKYRPLVKSVTVDGEQLNVAFGGEANKVRTRAEENASTYPDYVKTLNDYLNPTIESINEILASSNQNSWMVGQVKLGEALTLEAMKSYTAINDTIIVKETSNGNHTLSDKSWYYHPEDFPAHGDGKHYRVAKGTVITEVFHINASWGVINDAVIYIEGTVHLNGNTLNGPTLVVAEGGKIIVDGNTNMSNAGRIIVMPGGEITGADGVSFNVNNGMPCYNAGTITFNGELNVNGSDMYNNGTINVDVLRNTSGGKFTNFGQITARTNKQAADSYNSTVINGCYMHFKEDAGIGTLTLLDNSRLDVDGRAEFNMATQTLYNLSEINAGAIYLNSTKFAGPTANSAFAVIKTAKVWANQGADLAVSGNVYFDWNVNNLVNHKGEADFNSTVDNGYTTLSYIKSLNLNFINEASSPVSIPKGTCTGNGYNSSGGGGIDPGEPVVYTYAYEDTFMGDYDMNDVVLYVNENKNNTDSLDITLMCTGASFDLKVYYNLEPLFGGREVHAVLGGDKGKFINTGDTSNDKFEKRTPVTTHMKKPSSGFAIGSANFWVLSPMGEITINTNANAGGGLANAPYGIVIPEHKWKWPTEWTRITNAYEDFSGFAADRNNNKNWYTKITGSVYNQ